MNGRIAHKTHPLDGRLRNACEHHELRGYSLGNCSRIRQDQKCPMLLPANLPLIWSDVGPEGLPHNADEHKVCARRQAALTIGDGTALRRMGL